MTNRCDVLSTCFLTLFPTPTFSPVAKHLSLLPDFLPQCTKRRKHPLFTLTLRSTMILDQSRHQTKQLPTSIKASERGMAQDQCYLHIKHLLFLNRNRDHDDFTEPYQLLAKWIAHSEMPFVNFTMILNAQLDLLSEEEINDLYVNVLFIAV